MASGNAEQPKQLKNVAYGFVVRGDAGSTVRLSDRYKNAQAGDKYRLWVCAEAHSEECPSIGCTYCGVGTVLGVWHGLIVQIPTGLIVIEQDHHARSREGLLAALSKAYGRPVTEDEHCHVLVYTRE